MEDAAARRAGNLLRELQLRLVFPNRPYLRYAIVAAMAVCAVAADRLLSPVLDPDYLVPFLIVVLLSAWFCGLGAGMLAVGLTTGALLMQHSGHVSMYRFVTYLLSAAIMTYLVDEVRQMSGRWEATLSSIGDGVVVVDRAGRVKFLNPAAEAMTGWTFREARKKRLEEVFKLADEKTGETIDPPARRLLEEGLISRVPRQKILICRDGHEALVEESSAPVRSEKGKVIGAVLVFRDVTARREVQDQMNQFQRMDAVGRLAGGVAGDFNDLLTMMTGYSEMLRADLDQSDHRWRFADEIYVAADRAAGLTRQLTTLGNRHPGLMKVQDLSALVTSMETMLRRILGGQIELLIVPGSGKVKIDASQLEQAVVNLAMNSRDAMPQGGKFVIEISSMEIDERQGYKWPGLKTGNYVMMAVSDTGTGMDAETRSHLFEPFFTTKKRGKGTGLGLSIVYGIIQQSGGYINVYSQVGAGTIFEIFLPREKGTGEYVLQPVRPRAKRGTETVLIVDDEDGVRKLVYSILAANGYKVLEARDGAEALAVYEANQDKVSIVVTDLVMPNMTGTELGQRLNQLNPALSVLYTSGYQDNLSGDAEQARKDAFLQKPFKPEGLLTKVRELLDRATAEGISSPQS
jgi:two-component system, cell cycle sensor histidine kinase and response regulator CckA